MGFDQSKVISIKVLRLLSFALQGEALHQPYIERSDLGYFEIRKANYRRLVYFVNIYLNLCYLLLESVPKVAFGATKKFLLKYNSKKLPYGL